MAARDLDLGPIKIVDCTFSKSSTESGTYTLTLDVGPHRVELVSSLLGNSIHVFIDEQECQSASSQTVS